MTEPNNKQNPSPEFAENYGSEWFLLREAKALGRLREQKGFAPPASSKSQLPPYDGKAAKQQQKDQKTQPPALQSPAVYNEAAEPQPGYLLGAAAFLRGARAEKGLEAAPRPKAPEAAIAESTPALEPAPLKPAPKAEPKPEPELKPEPAEAPAPQAAAPKKGRAAQTAAVAPAEQEARPKPKARRWLVAAAVAVVVVGALAAGGLYISSLPPVVESVTVADSLNDDLTVTIDVQLKSRQLFDQTMWGALGEGGDTAIADDGWQQANEDGVVSFDVEAGEFYIYTKNQRGNIGTPELQSVEINEIVSIELNKETVYMPLGGADSFAPVLFVLGDADQSVEWATSDASVVTVGASGALTAGGVGTATVTATTQNGLTASGTVVVSDLFQLPEINNSKPIIPAYYYSEEENDLLDAALGYRVSEAGYGTRSGPVAAARFLTMEFPWFIQYFYENGRLNNHAGRGHVDGEGRYYHIGLYLHESRYDSITATLAGPSIWGAPLMNFEDDGYFKPGGYYPNGLSCSGFVSWCLLNGGFDVGDSGAGDYLFADDDLCDLGERVTLTEELMRSGRVQVGDLIGEDGHIAIIIGFDEEYIYIAESLGRGVRVSVLERYRGVVNSPDYDYVMLMDSVYGESGNLTDYWE